MPIDPRKDKTRFSYGFKEIRDFLTDINKKAQKTVDKINVEVLRAAKTELVARVEGQKFDHPPLSDGYLSWKVSQNLDSRILIATRTYLGEIDVYRTKDFKSVGKFTRGAVFLGVPNTVHEPSGVDLRALAVWLEAGTPTMPPRPHFGPIEKWVNKRIALLLLKAGFTVSFRGNKA